MELNSTNINAHNETEQQPIYEGTACGLNRKPPRNRLITKTRIENTNHHG